MKISRIGVLSLGKIWGSIYAILGLLISLFFMVLILIGFSKNMGGASMEIITLLLVPLLYGILGVVTGVVFALLFNVVAGLLGGLEIEVEKEKPPYKKS